MTARRVHRGDALHTARRPRRRRDRRRDPAPALTITVDVLAALRLTRLALDDSITSDLRERVFAYAVGDVPALGLAHPKLVEFLACPWCVSIWAALVVVFVLDRSRAGRALVRTLAISEVVGIVRTHDA